MEQYELSKYMYIYVNKKLENETKNNVSMANHIIGDLMFLDTK